MVLLILAGVTINLVLADGGIFGKAEQAKLAQTLGEYKDKIEIAKATVAADKDNLGKVPLAALKTELERIGMTVTETGTGENAKLEVTVPEIEEKIEITQNGNNVDVKYPDNITGSGTTGETTVSVESVTLDKNSVTMTVGETTTLTATVNPSNANNTAVTWTSSNSTIVSVDANGVVTANKSGIVTITATAGGKTANCTVTVPTASGQIYLTTTQVSDLNVNTKPYLPTTNFEVVPTANTLAGGLVIREKPIAGEQTNEYVWIEVPTTIYDDTTVNSNGANKPANNTEYAKIEACLKQYTTTYRNGTTYADVYDASLNNSTAVNTSYTGGGVSVFASETAYNSLKNKMLASVYDNGGFWIGRYEAGIETARTALTDEISASLKPLSQPDKQPITYVTRNQAQDLATRILPDTATTASTTSSLMFGVQWDLVLKYLEVKEAKTTTELNSDSSSWGNYTNYPNTTYPVDGYSSGNRSTTGKSDYWSANNIYDLAGNVWEWTLEKTSVGSHPCASRGGLYSNPGSAYPASSRGNYLVGESSDRFGLRVSLY